jgi:lactoylglutathione lyase
MTGPDGSEYPNENVFSEIDWLTRVVIEHPGEPVFRLDLRLEPSHGGTLITWLQSFENDEIAKRMEPIVTRANEQNLDRWQAEVIAAKPGSGDEVLHSGAERRPADLISRLGQVMLYVSDQDKCAEFWTKTLGFYEVARFDSGTGFKWIEVAPPAKPGATIVLHNKEAVAKMAPELNLGTPSLMFFTPSADKLREDLSTKGVKVGPIDLRPDGKVFNFSDIEGNYFAVLERP